MDKATLLHYVVQASYFAAAVLFIMGIKRMSSPVTARSGIQWAGIGMLVATIATFFHGNVTGGGEFSSQTMTNILLMVLAIGISTAFAWISGKKVAMTDMPQMVALYNGMGGGSAAAIGAAALIGAASGSTHHARPYADRARGDRCTDRLDLVHGVADRVRETAGLDGQDLPLRRSAGRQRPVLPCRRRSRRIAAVQARPRRS